LSDAAASTHRSRRPPALPGKGIRRARLDRRRTPTRSRHLQYRRHADALERRQAAVDLAPRAHAAGGRISRAALFAAVLLPGQQGRRDPRPGQEIRPITAHDYLQQRIAANYAR
jgi:hypothetical protein